MAGLIVAKGPPYSRGSIAQGDPSSDESFSLSLLALLGGAKGLRNVCHQSFPSLVITSSIDPPSLLSSCCTQSHPDGDPVNRFGIGAESGRLFYYVS